MAAGIVEELTGFLRISAQPELRIAALRNVAGLTCDEAGVSFILKHKDLLESVLALLKDKIRESVLIAYTTLINITATEDGASCIVNEFDIFGEIISAICNPESVTADEASKLLNNLTRSESGSFEFLNKCENKLSNESHAEYALLKEVINSFCKVGFNKHSLGLDHVASVLANVTQTVQGRRFMSGHDNSIIMQLLPFLRHESLIRRKGIASVIKNCCFEHEYHERLLGDDLELLPQLLLPLAGPEEFTDEENDKLPLDLQYLPEDKQRESDFVVRKTLVEALILLCADKFGRNYQKNNGVYYIIRELHLWESEHGPEENEDECDKLAQILIADEPAAEMENLMKVPDEVLEKYERR